MGCHESFDPTNAIPFSLGTMGEALPAPGSPEALEAFGAACRAVDAASRLSDAEMEALAVAPGGPSLWTSDKVRAAQTGDFSRFHPREIEAARAPRGRALRRCKSSPFVASCAWRRPRGPLASGMLHALVYGEEPDPADEDEAPAADEPAIAQAIEAHRTAQTAFTAASWAHDREHVRRTGGDTSDEAMAAAQTAWEAADAAETQAWTHLLKARPAPPAGLLQMLRYIGSATTALESVTSPGAFARDIAEAAETALGQPAVVASADPRLVAMVAEWQEQRHKHDDPVFRETPEANETYPDHAGLQREIDLYPARTPLDLLAKAPVFRDELAEAIRGANGEPTENMAGAAWTGLLADIERIAGTAPAFLPPDDAELIALAGPWKAAHQLYEQRSKEQEQVERIAEAGGGWPGPAPEGAGDDWRDWPRRADEYREQTGINDAEAASNDALDDLAEIEDRVAAMPAHTLAGLRLKARIAERNSSIDVEWPEGLGDGMVRDLLAITGDPSGLRIPPVA